MRLDEITPLILAYNEQENIVRVLDSVAWARRIVVVDSGSNDLTADLVAAHENAEFIQRPFDNHTSQWNFGVKQVSTPWVLALDADYICPDALAAELRELAPEHDAYQAQFTYCINGKPLRGTLYPARAVLFRADRLRFRQDGHTQLLDVTGPVGELRSVILHDDRKSLRRWLANQAKYADLEVEKLLTAPPDSLGWMDRLRKRILWAPPLTFVYCLFWKRLVLDGWPGIFYSLQRTYAELLLSLKLLDARLRTQTTPQLAATESANQSPRFVGGDSVADARTQVDSNGQSASEPSPTLKATSTTERHR